MPYRRYRRRRRRPTRRWRHRRWRRYFRYRYRRAPRRRRTKVRRRRRKAPVIQWFPPSRRTCLIEGFWPLSHGHWFRTCPPMRRLNGLIFTGGGCDWTQWSLQNLYHEKLNWRNIWTASNVGMEFARFLRGKFYFFRHPWRSYIVTWDQDIPCKPLPYQNLQPLLMLLKKQHKLVLSQKDCNPNRKQKPVTLKFRPPPKLTSQWRLSRELSKIPLIRLGISLIDLSEPWLEGWGNAFYSVLGYEASKHSGRWSNWTQMKYFWIYDTGVGNAVYVILLKKDVSDNPGDMATQFVTGSGQHPDAIDHIEMVNEGWPYWLFFYGQSEQGIKKLAHDQDIVREYARDPKSKKLKIGVIGWASSNYTTAGSNQNTQSQTPEAIQGGYVAYAGSRIPGAGSITNLFQMGWPGDQNWPPTNQDQTNFNWGLRGLCVLRDNMKLGAQELDDECTMLSLFGPFVEKANTAFATNDPKYFRPELKDYNVVTKYAFKFQWGGHGTERFKTTIGDPSTIPCPFEPGERYHHGVQDPAKVQNTVLNPWDYDCDGIVRTDTLKRLLELPTETEETEKAYPLLGQKTEKEPLSDSDEESVISSTSSGSSQEEETQRRRQHKPSKRRLLKHLQRVVKRMKTL
ncbi:ORF1 protein [Porcine torque teno virus 2]|uniref:Capsid protein n=1 Tax=Porcine torque teno virus 2 TaxID=871765 RepID=G8Z9V8_9VIRU|nr:ORF1 protein [Porcine torque teno virus 2]